MAMLGVLENMLKAISDRSGMEFPYKEMVKEWNGSFVHKSEPNLNIHKLEENIIKQMRWLYKTQDQDRKMIMMILLFM